MTEFDLFVDAEGDAGACALLAVTSAGVARERATIPIGDEAFGNLGVRVASKEKNLAIRQQFGKQLFDAVFRGTIRDAWVQASQDGDGVRLRLVVEAGPLATLPWELLNDGLNFLATDARLAVSRYIPVPEPPRAPVIDKLKVLLATASPGGVFPPIPPEEVDALEAAIGGGATVSLVRGCTSRSLAEAIVAADYHVVHYLGHGAKGRLILEGQKKDAFEAVSDQAFAQMVFGRPSIRLVVLSACSSAEATDAGVFSGVGPALIRTRIPAVVAMQYEFVQLSTAQAFNARFYKDVGAGVPVDVAVNRARNTISATGDLLAQRDWSTPVLYLGTRNGRLITLAGDHASQVERAAQSVQAAAMQHPAAAQAWHELQETFEVLWASHLMLAALTELRDLVAEAREEFDEIVTAASGGIGLAAFTAIASTWKRMAGGSIGKTRKAAAALTDAGVRADLQPVLDRFVAMNTAVEKTDVGALTRDIPAIARALADANVALARRVSATITELLATSERTLGKLSAKD